MKTQRKLSPEKFRKIQLALKSNAGFAVLDAYPRMRGCDWGAGWCLPLALAMKEVFGGEIVAITRDRDRQAEHMGLKYDGKIYDIDGAHDPASWIQHYQKADGLYLQGGYSVVPASQASYGMENEDEDEDEDEDEGIPEPDAGAVRDLAMFITHAAGSSLEEAFRDEQFVRDEETGKVFWGSSASGAAFIIRIEQDEARILLLKRSADVEDPGKWGIPGGAIPVDEDTGKKKDALDSALTESEEEMGGLPEMGAVLGKTEFKKGSFIFTTFFIEAKVSTKVAPFSPPQLNWESDDWRWFPVSALPKNVHPGVAWAVAEAQKQNIL